MSSATPGSGPVFRRIPTLRSAAEFKARLAELGLEIPCDDEIVAGRESPLTAPARTPLINGKLIGNRFCIQPMEGWDGTTGGAPTEETRRRWRRFGESGAKLIFGGEAMAVRPDGRANPNQLLIIPENKSALARLRAELMESHRRIYGRADDLVIGFQLTHSGRFCRPNEKQRYEPKAAYRHPLLDARFHVDSDDQIFTDAEVEELIGDYVRAAGVAAEAGADFVDIKHCHGYLLHEFLSAFSRPGKFGGSFHNRTRIAREIVSGIRASGIPIDIAVRLSAFDFVPFRPDPERSRPGQIGPGVPEDFSQWLPYRFAFGANPENPLESDLSEAVEFARLCGELGIKLLNITAGSPYYTPHIQRPAAYPPSDGYAPAYDPLIDVARQIRAAREIRRQAPAGLLVIGSAYSYLQEYLPHVAQAVVRERWADLVGLGRVALSYPAILSDASRVGKLNSKTICRTFSDCTTAPRRGMVSGCYPLDPHYAAKPEAQILKQIKKAVRA